MKTNSLFKRLVSMLIVVLMICTVFPVTALAEDGVPNKPTDNRIKNLLAVKIYCTNVEGGDHESYSLLNDTYQIGEVTGNETDGYTCTVTINSDQYILKYSNTRWPRPIAHELAEGESQSKTVTLVYEQKWIWDIYPIMGHWDFVWDLPESSNGTIRFDVVHEKTYTLSYNANGGNGAPAEQKTETVDVGQSATLTISGTKPTKEGYDFKGWATSETATSATYQPGNEITINANTILYAVWEKQPEKVTYTLTYDANGGTGAPSAQSDNSTADSFTFTISATVPTRGGYTFKGWAETANATAANVGSSYTLYSSDPSKTLYAVWEKTPVTYTLTYDANGGNGAPSAQSDKSTADSFTFTISATVPTRGGYTFKGWAETANATAANVGSSYTLYSSDPSKTLYAVWEKNAPTYDELNRLFGNSAVTILCTNTEAKHNPATYGLLPNSENENDSYSISKPQKDEKTGLYTCNITVFADPYVKQYSTDIRKEHSLDDDKSKTITLIYVDNNDYKGWVVETPVERSTAPAFTGVTFNVVCKETPVTTYTVTYKDGVGGKVFKDDVHTVKSGATTPAFVGGIPTRPGYVFVGWTPAVSGTVTGDATYTATWRKVKDTTVIEIGGGNSSSSSSKEENPNTGAPVFVGVSVGALAAAK